jgi:hypothetical protein
LSQLLLSRNLHVDFYPWHKLVLVSDPSKFEQASELVRKSLHFFLLLPPLISPKCGVDIDGLIFGESSPLYLLSGDQERESSGSKWR